MADMTKKNKRLKEIVQEISELQKVDPTSLTVDQWSRLRYLERSVHTSLMVYSKSKVKPKIDSYEYEPRQPYLSADEFFEKQGRKDLQEIYSIMLNVGTHGKNLTDAQIALIPEFRGQLKVFSRLEEDAKKEWKENRLKHIEQFRKDMEEEFGTEDHPQRDLMWEMGAATYLRRGAPMFRAMYDHYADLLQKLRLFGV